MLRILHVLLMGPLELLFDVVYAYAFKITQNPGISIIFLSLTINLLVLPLYRRADAMQEEERIRALKMKPGIDHIKKVFKGDERIMMLQTYYRQNNYKPYYTLKGSLSLLLEIPFFIAAFRYLSGLKLLNGAPFGLITDLGKPDDLLMILRYDLHLLPILMTVINIISGAIYTKGQPLKSKIQLYGMALIFLVLLYESPSGLVFYWTLNNLFSLIKNIFYKIPSPRKILSVLCSVIGFFLLIIFFIVWPVSGLSRIFIVSGAAILLQFPLAKFCFGTRFPQWIDSNKTGYDHVMFYICCFFLTILVGILIPSAIINDSPSEFVELSDYHSPLRYVFHSSLLAIGTFLVWGIIFYHLSAPQTKRIFILGSVVLSSGAAINYMFFGKDYGNLSSQLRYDLPLSITRSRNLSNFAVLMVASILVFLIFRMKSELLKVIFIAGSLAVAIMSVINLNNIRIASIELKNLAAQRSTETPSFVLDKKGKNVVVIMLDRAISGFLPFIFAENKEVAEQFKGFSFYPNTFSYGLYTNVGVPTVYGGYEYMPYEINKRVDETLKDKHNEALKVMPVIFSENGFDVTVCDPPYANYQLTPDLSIFDDYPEIHRYNTHGAFSENEQDGIEENTHIIKRNLFCYAVFRTVPTAFQKEIYDNGLYNEASSYIPNIDPEKPNYSYTPYSMTYSTGTRKEFLAAYKALQNMPYMTKITDQGKNTFLLLSNTTTHEENILQKPEYEPKNVVDNSQYEATHGIRTSITGKQMKFSEVNQMEHYDINMAALILLGKWLDYLRENQAWDNTRIIIVADHGRYISLNRIIMDDGEETAADTLYYEQPIDYNPLFLIKDFDSKEFKIDYSFMTNADTPTEAFRDLIPDPINPFTGNRITNDRKNDPEQYALVTNWKTNENNGNTFTDPIRITLKNHYLFDYDNWTFEK